MDICKELKQLNAEIKEIRKQLQQINPSNTLGPKRIATREITREEFDELFNKQIEKYGLDRKSDENKDFINQVYQELVDTFFPNDRMTSLFDTVKGKLICPVTKNEYKYPKSLLKNAINFLLSKEKDKMSIE